MLLLSLLTVTGLSGTGHAHPHIFVDAGADFLFDGDSLRALRVSWTYDEFTTLYMFDTLDLDPDGDGALTEADHAAIVAGETEWPPDYEGDVYLDVAGEKRALTRPQNGSAGMRDGRITVTFELPLAIPADLSGTRARLRLYDPVYYYAYSVTGSPAVSASACAATVIPFEPDAAAAELQVALAAISREETPAQPDVGALFADAIVLTCE